MANDPGNRMPLFQEGRPVSASALTRAFASIFKRIQGAAPVRVSSANGNLIISLADVSTARVPARTILATIDAEVGFGVYTWTAFSRGPAEYEVTINNQCVEVNSTLGIPAGTVVELQKDFKIGDTTTKWWFSLPQSSSTNYVIKHYDVAATSTFTLPFADITAGRPFMAIVERHPALSTTRFVVVLPLGANVTDGQVVVIKNFNFNKGGVDRQNNCLIVHCNDADHMEFGSGVGVGGSAVPCLIVSSPLGGDTDSDLTPEVVFASQTVTLVWEAAIGKWWFVGSVQPGL